MSKTTELSVIEIKLEQAPALYVANGLDGFLDQIRSSVNEVPDLSTAKGRARIASLSASVSRSKTAIEKPGRELLKKIKEQPKIIEAELRRFISECDTLRDEVRRPLTEWEEEQERIRLEEESKAEAERYSKMRDDADKDNTAFDLAKAKELALQIEAAHATALLDNYEYDRDIAEKKAEAERQRIAHEEELKRQAVEQAQREADEKIQREREASAKREADLKAQAEQAERDRIDVAAKAEADRLAAAQQAEREKQEAIAAEQLKAKQEADRIQRETKQKEDARLAEERRLAEEAAARAANIEHQKTINNQVIAILTKAGLSTDCAKECVIAIVKNQNAAAASGMKPPVQINY
ncbi:hypothetical protein [Rahnella sp. ERMR1:05]|uniref:Cell envelope biogenesis protein TolA n=1 Tax=Rahnella sikkimica TaxID=1805933 RepID=A0A2L1UWY4_9GAMM|nr:hypothetical protein BV494_04565 [Rahnella sikkimica]